MMIPALLTVDYDFPLSYLGPNVFPEGESIVPGLNVSSPRIVVVRGPCNLADLKHNLDVAWLIVVTCVL